MKRHNLFGLAAMITLAVACSQVDSDSNTDNTLVICEADAESGDAGDGSGSGVCETCECEEGCDSDDAYRDAYCETFPDDPSCADPESGDDPGDGSGSGSGSNVPFSVTNVPGNVITQCLAVAKLTYTKTFNCRDFTTWFLRCLNDRGHTGTGFDMWCKNCDSGKSMGHRIPIIRKQHNNQNMFCPVEPGWGNGWVVTDCCKTTQAAAQDCAHEKYCDGDWQAGDTRFEGCEKGGSAEKTCKYCLGEQCTYDEKKKACEAIEKDGVDDCGAKATNAECTACCSALYPNGGPSKNHCLSSAGAGCASKP